MHECSPYINSYGRSFTCITGMVFAGLKSRMVFACSYQYLAISNEQNVDKRHESSCKYVNYERLQLTCTCREFSAISDKLSKILRDDMLLERKLSIAW